MLVVVVFVSLKLFIYRMGRNGAVFILILNPGVSGFEQLSEPLGVQAQEWEKAPTSESQRSRWPVKLQANFVTSWKPYLQKDLKTDLMRFQALCSQRFLSSADDERLFLHYCSSLAPGWPYSGPHLKGEWDEGSSRMTVLLQGGKRQQGV